MNGVAFLIPILLECEERKRNLIDQIKHLSNFNANIYIIECDKNSIVPEAIGSLINSVNYRFVQSDSKCFHRTKLLNILAADAKQYNAIVLHDVDVFIDKGQYAAAYEKICDLLLDFCYPYTVWRWISHWSDPLQEPTSEPLLTSLGGSVMCRRSSFIAAGMENEKCMSWGYEDMERYWRWTTLGYKIGRIPGILYHAEHPRNYNSGIENPLYEQNKVEAEKVRDMNATDLEKYICTWSTPWLLANY